MNPQETKIHMHLRHGKFKKMKSVGNRALYNLQNKKEKKNS